ncbi:zinc-binding dehydrogenase [Kribbella sp. NBC_00382]|uniref:zinc-binding dehydrogenase n=1 Tax=Kribbella sp. NBC_00382 TaxID=2975967 RepID=UPI002E249CF6
MSHHTAAPRTTIARWVGPAFIAAAAIYVVAEAIVASAWDRRPYSYVDDYVNFLGSRFTEDFRGYTISSPLWWLMDIAWALTGVLVAAAVISLSRRLSGWRRSTITALGIAQAVALILFAVFPLGQDTVDNGTLALYLIGAFLSIIAGNCLAIVTGLSRRLLGLPRWLGTASITLGAIGLVNIPATYGWVPTGIAERISLYSYLLWVLTTGIAILRTSSPAGLPVAVEASTVVTEAVLPGKVEPSGITLVQRELPAPTAGQARVRIESTGVSFAESAMRRGRYFGQPPFPFVPGYDLVGVVEAVGPGEDQSLVGRRVAALTKTGGWATAALLPVAELVQVPHGISAAEAETLIVNGLTAYQMLYRTAKVSAGQTILVLGASGGVGTILVQLARQVGAQVIGTANPRHHDALRALGVQPVDYRDPELVDRIRELAPDGVDAVFDHLGGASVNTSYGLLNRTGTLVSYSIAGKLDDKLPVIMYFLPLLAKLAFWNYLPSGRHASFFDIWAGSGKPGTPKREQFRRQIRTDLTEVFGLLSDGVLTAQIAARYPLAEVAAAVKLSESSDRTALGKILLMPDWPESDTPGN